ncbi:MAG: hemolysin family protein [Anaerolineae bacterium]
MNTALGLLAVFGLVFVNGVFVAAEFAFVGARRTRIAQLAAEGHTGARSAQRAIQHLDSYIAATQLGITLASLALGWIGEPALGHLVESALESLLPADLSHDLGAGFSFALAFSVVTMLHIVLGELAPKSIALQRPEGTAIIVARPVTAFLRLFRPVIFLMNSVGNGVVRLLGFEPASGHERVHSAEELLMLVHSSREAGLLEDTEERLLQRAFDFSELYLRDVMQPRVEVEGIPVDAPFSVVLQRVASGTYSRYPVYEDSLDQVVGVLHAKDLFDALVNEPALLCGEASFDLRSVLRTPLYFPEMANVGRVLEQMQRAKMPFTVVVDEFGGTAGIATMEDILEELVGDVQDEFDAEQQITSADAAASLVDGLTTLSDIAERFGDPGCEVHSATIGGYVAECLDRIPTVGDRVTYGAYDVIVVAMDEMRVAQVQFVPRASTDPARPESP